jgi:Ala-tRNA(Pro) deacylase
MPIPARLKSHLDEAHVSYLQTSHMPTHSTQYAASVMHAPGKEVAKTVVLGGGENNLLAVLPASYHINLKQLSVLVGVPVGLLEEKECNKLFPDCEPGTVPAFGEL